MRRKKLSLRGWASLAALGLAALVLAAALTVLVFGNAILNGYLKGKFERGFAAAHPGSTLRLGRLDYAAGANRLVAQSATLVATNSTLTAGRISLTGVRWARLLRGKASLAGVFSQASLEATNLNLEFPQAHYGLRCGRLRASVPDSEFMAERTELRSLIPDEELFAADAYRTTRFHVTVPQCKITGVAFGDLIENRSYRAKSIQLLDPAFDALVNRDKPVAPFVKSPLMAGEALAAIQQPLEVDSLSITNGHITYAERVEAGAAPGILTFGAVAVSVTGLANRREASAAIQLRAQGDFMNAALLKVQMKIPVESPDFSFHYSGTLSAMDLTRLNAFLEIAERTRIKSGAAQEAAFDITVTGGRGHGQMGAVYKDLKIAILDQKTDTEKGIQNRLASLAANTLKIRNANDPNSWISMKAGVVDYTRKPEDEFLQFAWFTLRSGVLDVISH